MNDLHLLRTELSFKPLLPPGLALPSGHRYNRVVWAGAPVNGFGIFISSQDPTAGSRAIHMDEGLLSAADLVDARYPMNAFRSILRPVTLGNGVWFEMQQQHAPWQGEWILIAAHGNIAIQIDGLDSKQLLERFAASLVRSS
jgi:hypothetical protein